LVEESHTRKPPKLKRVRWEFIYGYDSSVQDDIVTFGGEEYQIGITQFVGEIGI